MKLLLTLFAVFSASKAFAVDPPSYPLKCRGGNIETLRYNFAPTVASLSFKKSDHAAAAGLNPGECSWMDRAIGPSEPSLVEVHVMPPKNMFGTTSIVYGYAPSAAKPVMTANAIIGIRDPELGWLKALPNPDSYWMFKVYNDRIGHFIATDSQPSTADAR